MTNVVITFQRIRLISVQKLNAHQLCECGFYVLKLHLCVYLFIRIKNFDTFVMRFVYFERMVEFRAKESHAYCVKRQNKTHEQCNLGESVRSWMLSLTKDVTRNVLHRANRVKILLIHIIPSLLTFY